MQVRRVAQGREARSQLGEREREHALDLCRIDGDGCRTDALAEELLGEQSSEGVPDDDRRLVETGDDPGVVLGDLVDAEVGDRVRVLPRLFDRRSLVRPAGRAGSVAGRAEQLDPGLPARGVQPQAVDEDNWLGHVRAPCSEGGDEAAVDDEVGAGDVRGAIAGEEQDEVGDLVRSGEPPGHGLRGGACLDVLGRVPCALATVSATPPSPSHRSVSTGPGLTVLTRTPRGPNSFDSALQRLRQCALGGAVVDDQWIGEEGVDRADRDDGGRAALRAGAAARRASCVAPRRS